MSTCTYPYGDHHGSQPVCGFWCRSVAEDALESAIHQYLTLRGIP